MYCTALTVHPLGAWLQATGLGAEGKMGAIWPTPTPAGSGGGVHPPRRDPPIDVIVIVRVSVGVVGVSIVCVGIGVLCLVLVLSCVRGVEYVMGC